MPGRARDNAAPAATNAREQAAVYVSPLVLQAASRNPNAEIPWIERVEGSLLMADISGFTAMSERLAESGREGAEILTDIINRYFTAMIDAAAARGGHNLKFGGDALLLFFEGEDHENRAAATALEMQRENKRQPGLRIGGSRLKPSVSIGIHSGEFWSTAVGIPGMRLQHVIFGEDVNRVVAAESEASAGEVVITPQPGRQGWNSDLRNGFEVIRTIPRVTITVDGAAPEIASSIDLSGFLPPPVLWSLRGGAAVTGEHRGVVVMFIHATGFEAIAETSGPDKALAALQEYTSRIVELTEKYGGFLASNDIYTEGVKFIVVFGAPIAREDDAANALRLAADLREWLPASGLALQHRIGVNGGNAFAGDIGAPSRREYTVMGDCVNLAARLMSAAEPGQVLASAATVERAGPGFSVRPLPPIRVKGKRDEIAVSEVTGVDVAVTAGADQRSPFVGRTRELEALRQACLDAEGGAGRTLVVTGEAGSGKSRLLLEMMQYAGARGWRIHHARCYSHAAGSPFAPWKTVLRSIFGGDGADLAETIRSIAPDHAALAPLLNPLLDLDLPTNDVVDTLDEAARGERLLDLLSAIVTGSSAEAPALVVIDDIHNSDEGSLELGRRIQRDAEKSRMLFAVAGRAVGRRLAAGPGRTDIALDPLDQEESERLATIALGRTAAKPAVIAGVVNRAQGNPLFIEEVARSIREYPGGDGDLGEGDGAVSDRLQNLVMARIDRLEPALRDAVKVSAVAGSDIDPAVVDTGLELMGATARAATMLPRLAGEGMLLIDPVSGRYDFAHSLLQEVAYGNLSFTVRRRIHGGIAQHVESSRSDLVPHFEVLAYHFGRSGDRPKAFEYSLKSGDRARSLFANDDAIRHYRRASSLATEIELSDAERAAVEGGLGDVYELTGRHAAAAAAYVAALNACLSASLRRNPDPASLDLGELARGRPRELRERAAELCRKIGYVCDRQSDYGRALAWFEASMEALPPGSKRGPSYVGLAGIMYRAGRYDEAADWAQRGLRSLAASGPSPELAHANNLLGVVCRDQGLLTRAIDHRLRALEMYERLGALTGQADTLNNLGLDLFSAGRWPEAIQRFQSCLEIAERIGDADLVAIVRNNLGEIYVCQGDMARAEEEFRWASDTAARMGNLALAGLAEANLGEALTVEGQLPESRAVLRKSIRTLKRLGAATLTMEAEVRLAELHFASRDYRAAETLANKLVDASRKVDARPIEARALRLLGLLAVTRKDPAAAETHLRQSIQVLGETGATHGEAKSRLALAGVTGDGAEARKALRTLQQLGATRDIAEAEAFLALWSLT